MPQCGLAPGFITIAAWDLIKHFDQLHDVRLRVGAMGLPPALATACAAGSEPAAKPRVKPPPSVWISNPPPDSRWLVMGLFEPHGGSKCA